MNATLETVKPMRNEILEPAGIATAIRLDWTGKRRGDCPSRVVLGTVEFPDSFYIEEIEAIVVKKFPAANWFNAVQSDGRWLVSSSI